MGRGVCGLPLRETSLNCLALEARVIYDPGLTQRTISRPTTNLWALHRDQNERPVFLRKRPTYLSWSFGLRGRLPAQSTAYRLEGPGVGLYEDSYTGSLCALPLPAACSSLVRPLKELISLSNNPSFGPGTREHFHIALALVANGAYACGSKGISVKGKGVLKGLQPPGHSKRQPKQISLAMEGPCSLTNRC